MTSHPQTSFSLANIRWNRCFFLIPILGSVVWCGMLIAMLICWSAQGKPTYWFMTVGQNPVFISDIGATNLKPLFISCAGWQGLFYTLTLLTEYYLRRTGLLQYWFKKDERNLLWAAIILGEIGQLGILFCSIFSTSTYSKVHSCMVGVFVVAVFLSLVCLITQYFLMARHYKEIHVEHKTMNKFMVSASLKLFWTVMAVIFAICFAAQHKGMSARFEWVVAFWYVFLFFIFACNLYPASKKHHKNYPFIHDYDNYYMYHEHFRSDIDKELDSEAGNFVNTEDEDDSATHARTVNREFTDAELEQYPVNGDQQQYPIPQGQQVRLYSESQ